LLALKNAFSVFDRWKLMGADSSEGLVFDSNLGGGGTKMLVSAAGATNVDGSTSSNILVFDVPIVSTAIVLDDGYDQGSLTPLYQLNAGIFTRGLGSDAKISALAYFEDILYVLHDNARVIRGWDVKTATMVSEWSTPRAGGHYDHQWEGLTLQRAGDFSIVAHMTLDTPAQIWSFVMEQSLSAGKTILNFPTCAQAF
jgi:hypothetical protein